MMSVTGDAQSAPLRVGYPVADTMGGITAAFAIAAALFRRERTGEGEFIDVSMLEASIVAMGWVVSNWLIAGERPQPHRQRKHDGGALRRVPHQARAAQHRRQQAGAVRGTVPADRAARTDRGRALCRAREPKAQPRALRGEIEAALRGKSAAEW